MATPCSYECQCKSFRFVDCGESKFYEFQWTREKIFFVIYRAFTFFYHWGWLIASWVLAGPDISYTISNWSFFFTGIYFMVAFATSLFGIIKRKEHTDDSDNTQTKSTDPERGNNQQRAEEYDGTLQWFHRTTWFFHVIAMSFVIYVTVLYWALLAPSLPASKLRQPLGQHKHSVQGFLLLLDMFLVAYPTRFLHFVYVMLFAFFYAIYVVIMHFSGVSSAAYGFLDFQKNAKLAAGVLVGATFAAPIILHTITFALYHLRAVIYRNTIGKNTANAKARFDTGHENVVFSAD